MDLATKDSLVKWVIISFLAFFAFAYLAQFFLQENLTITILNKTKASDVRLKVWLDENLIFDGDVSHSAPYRMDLNESFGKHKLTVFRNGSLKGQKEEINLYLIKWVYLFVMQEPDTIIKKEYLQPRPYF